MIKIDYFLPLLGSCEWVANFREAKPLHAKLARLRSYRQRRHGGRTASYGYYVTGAWERAKTYTWVLDRG